MLDKLQGWIKTFSTDEAVEPEGSHEWAKTLAGLLIEAAMASLFQKVERYKLPLRTSEEDAKEEGIRIEALHLKPITHNADGVDTALNATHGLVDFVLEKETVGAKRR